MTEYMSELDYKTSEDTRDDVLIQCAQEISMISQGRKLIGEFIGDFEIYDGYFLAQFGDRSNCEVTTDSIWVPCQYVYNKEYREFYKEYLIRDSVQHYSTQ